MKKMLCVNIAIVIISCILHIITTGLAEDSGFIFPSGITFGEQKEKVKETINLELINERSFTASGESLIGYSDRCFDQGYIESYYMFDCDNRLSEVAYIFMFEMGKEESYDAESVEENMRLLVSSVKEIEKSILIEKYGEPIDEENDYCKDITSSIVLEFPIEDEYQPVWKVEKNDYLVKIKISDTHKREAYGFNITFKKYLDDEIRIRNNINVLKEKYAGVFNEYT